MFTGIVEELGRIQAIAQLPDAARFTVAGPLVAADARPGDSIAVNGVCLTVVDVLGAAFTADVMLETLRRSSFARISPGDRVNLERAAAAGGRLGGHLVQGHVDGTGMLRDRESAEHWDVVRIGMPERLTRYVVEKGSIAVDGVSLTVVAAGPDEFTVSLIPTTLESTTLGGLHRGDPVNLEVDVVAKYVERLTTPYIAAAEVPDRGDNSGQD